MVVYMKSLSPKYRGRLCLKTALKRLYAELPRKKKKEKLKVKNQ